MDQGSLNSRDNNTSQGSSSPKSGFITAPAFRCRKIVMQSKVWAKKLSPTRTLAPALCLFQSPPVKIDLVLAHNYRFLTIQVQATDHLGWSLLPPPSPEEPTKVCHNITIMDIPMYSSLSGAEDLVPVLDSNLHQVSDEKSDTDFIIFKYRPRIGRQFSRIARWLNAANGESYWRTQPKDYKYPYVARLRMLVYRSYRQYDDQS